jgi:vancomycin resistance protein VanW
VVRFGSGAKFFYNYLDYKFTNDTNHTFQLLFWLDKKCVNGDLRVNDMLPYKYHIFEKNHHFVKIGESYFRRNELWREKYYKKGHGEIIERELLQKNNSLVKYLPDEYTTM